MERKGGKSKPSARSKRLHITIDLAEGADASDVYCAVERTARGVTVRCESPEHGKEDGGNPSSDVGQVPDNEDASDKDDA